MKNRANIVVIGGGGMGTSVAYNLAKKGAEDVVLIEKGYLGSGSTGRCGTGIRAQYAKKERIVMGREAINLWENLSEELNFDTKYAQTGYIYLFYSEEEFKDHCQYIKLQNSLGVNTRTIKPEEVKEIVPILSIEGVVGVAYGPKDGKADPFKVVFAYADAAKKLGVNIYTYTEVEAIEFSNGEWIIKTNKGEIRANVIVNAAGSWSSLIGKMVNVEIPIFPFVEEAIITEPVAENTIGPLINFQSPLFGYTWCTQTLVDNGIIAGWGHMQWVPEVISYDMTVSQGYVKKLANQLIKGIPGLASVNISRQFSGFYDITPDREPILDKVPGMNFYIAAAAGFMHIPICGKAMAELVLEGQSKCMPVEAFSLDRFNKGEVKRIAY